MKLLELEVSTLTIADTLNKPHRDVFNRTRVTLNDLNREHRLSVIDGITVYLLTKRDATNVAASLDPKRLDILLQKIEELEARVNQPRQTLQNTYLKRLEDNYRKLPVGYFSVLTEMLTVFNEHGVSIDDLAPNKHPDVSAGQVFAKYLKDEEVEARYIFYMHDTGKAQIQAKAYPEALLPDFRAFMRAVWYPKHSHKFLPKRLGTVQ